MTATLFRPAAFLAVGLALVGFGCDRSPQGEAEREAPQKREQVPSGNLNQAMGAGERIVPRLPTPRDRFLLAVRQGNREEAARWLDRGASVADGAVLVAAVRGEGDLAFVEWLLGRGAGVDVADDAGRTPLSWAAGDGSERLVDYLLTKGADVKSTDRLGRTPLHFGVFSADDAVVRRLLAASAAVDAQDSLGGTPLMYACSKNESQIVQTLLQAGADPSLEDKLGRTAEERGHGEANPCVISSSKD